MRAPLHHTIRSFEGGRGIAALAVALYHLPLGSVQLSPIRNGYLFVDMFFVLSGFVICASYASALHTMADFRAFMIRRFGRLFPLLLASTIFFVLMHNATVFAKRAALAHGYGTALQNPGALDYLLPGVPEILSTLTLTHGMGVFDRLILNYASWSISTEFYVYILFAAVCVLLAGSRRTAAFALLGAAGLAVTVWATLWGGHACPRDGRCFDFSYDFGFARCVFSFFLGALAWRFGHPLRQGTQSMQFAGLILLTLLFSLLDVAPALAFAFPAVFALLVLSVRDDRGALAALLGQPVFQALGQRSYSIYLMHPVLLFLFSPFAKRANGLVSGALVAAVYVAVLVLVSGLTYRWIEDPFRTLFNRLAGIRRPPTQPITSQENRPCP